MNKRIEFLISRLSSMVGYVDRVDYGRIEELCFLIIP